MECYGLNVWAYDSPLARPILTHSRLPMNVTALHTVGPRDIIGKRRQYAVYVSGIEAIVHFLDNVNIIFWHNRPQNRRKGSMATLSRLTQHNSASAMALAPATMQTGIPLSVSIALPSKTTRMPCCRSVNDNGS